MILFCNQNLQSVLLCGGTVFLLGLSIRIWSAGYLNKNEELTTTGPYALCRNPLYLGSALGFLSFCIMNGLSWVSALYVLILAPIYYLCIQSEEKYLLEKFPIAFAYYKRQVAVIFPNIFSLNFANIFDGRFSFLQFMRNSEYKGIVFQVIVFFAFLISSASGNPVIHFLEAFLNKA